MSATRSAFLLALLVPALCQASRIPRNVYLAQMSPLLASSAPKGYARSAAQLVSPNSNARKLQQHWVGTDMPSFNAASMNWYQGYPNRFRASNAASSFQAASMGSPDNFGAGYNPYMGGHRKLQQHWVGTDMPSFNAASMNWYQGYPNRFRASNAASSFQAASMGSPDNFGAGYNPYMGGHKK